MDRWRAAAALLALAACFACSAAAPTAGNHSALDLYDGAVVEGCYYNFQHYGEGDRIMTNEPCLNCTCHNRMLMCYLRVCPFTKPIGQNCTVEKRADQCCPIVTCPDVPVDLLTSTSTSSPAEYGATGVGHYDKYGCSIDGKYLPEGAKVPPTPNKPCEHCYCIRNMTTCIMQECTLHVDGCTPIYHKDVCCPVRYSCDHPEDEILLLDDMTTTVRPTPGFILTTTTVSPVTQVTQDCVHDDKVFADGVLIKTEKACEHCYCMKGDIVCVVQECGTPMENEGKNCTSLPPREGQCCPDTYICEGDESNTEYPSEFTTNLRNEELTTLSPPRRVGDEGSGYRKESEEISITEHTPISETVGDKKTTGHSEIITEKSTLKTQKPHIVEQEFITTDTVPLETEKHTLESQTDEAATKADEEKKQPNYEKSTEESITEGNLDKISSEVGAPVLGESVNLTTESIKPITEVSEKGTTESYIESWKTTPYTEEVPESTRPTKSDNNEITTSEALDKKEQEGISPATTSTPVHEKEIIALEQVTPETMTTGSKTIVEIETIGSTVTDSHTLTLEEVEKEESGTENHKIDIEKVNEDFTTESQEFVSISDSKTFTPESDSHKSSNADEGFNKEITETYEFIPITTSVSTIDLKRTTTESNKVESITENETEEKSSETPLSITSIPGVVTESTTLRKNEIATEKTEIDPALENHETLSSTTSIMDNKEIETSTLYKDTLIDRTTESHKNIPSYTDVSVLTSDDTEKGVTQDHITSNKRTSTTSIYEGIDRTLSTDVKTELDTTTVSPKFDDSLTYLTTVVPSLYQDKDLLTPPSESGEDITSPDPKYTSSELPLAEMETGDTTTEPDRGLNTIPADKKYEDIVTSAPLEVESHVTKDEEILYSTEAEEEEEQRTTTEYIEKELLTSKLETYDNTELPAQQETKYPTLVPIDYDHSVADHSTHSTTDIITIERELETSTEFNFEKTDKPELSTVNQGENEIYEEALIPGRIPGEGDCLLNGVTYRNESNVPSSSNCHTGCKCLSSIIKCDPIICSPAPDYMDNCQPTYDPPDACCPIYECTHISKETMPPQPQNQMAGTESSSQRPSFDCRGDQCEISEDKVQVPVSYETCTGDKCDKVGETSVPQDFDLGQTDICRTGKCDENEAQPIQPCEGVNCIHSESLPTEICDNCDKGPIAQSLPCEGDKCGQTNPPTEVIEHSTVCKEDGDCPEVLDQTASECEGESCRKETTGSEVKLPPTCTDSKCLESTGTIEHQSIGYESITSVPYEQTKPTEQFSLITFIDQTTTKSEYFSTIPEISGIITTPKGITLDLSTQTSAQSEFAPSETETDTSTRNQDANLVHDHTTEQSIDGAHNKLTTVTPKEYYTAKVEDTAIITEKVELEHEMDTESPGLDDTQDKPMHQSLPEYTTEPILKETTVHTTQVTIDTNKILSEFPERKPLDMQKDERTESYDTDLEKVPEPYGLSTEKDLSNEISEQIQEDKVTKYEPDMTEHKISESPDMITELPIDKGKPEAVADVHIPKPILIDTTSEESHSTEKVEMGYTTKQMPQQEKTEKEQYITEIATHIDEALSTTASSILATYVMPQDDEKYQSVGVTDKNYHIDEKIPDTLVTEQSTTSKPVDSVVLMVTTSKELEPEIITSVPEKGTTTTQTSLEEQKIKYPTTSEIDAEEYITEEPGLSLFGEEKLATTPDEIYTANLESLTEVPKPSEDILKEPILPELSTIAETDNEIHKESSTTQLPKISEAEEYVTEELGAIHAEKGQFPIVTTIASLTVKEPESEEPIVDLQQELNIEHLVPITDKLYTEVTEKETDNFGKPESELVTMNILSSTPGIYTDVDTVTEQKTISPENEYTESTELFTSSRPDLKKPVTETKTEDDELNKMTTLEDKIHLEHESSTKTNELLDTSTEVKDHPEVDEDELKVSKSSTTVTMTPESAEHISLTHEDTSTVSSHEETITPETESKATTIPTVLQENQTKSSVVLEDSEKPMSNHSVSDTEQKTTQIPTIAELEHQIDSKPHTESTTEHFVSELLEYTVTESKEEGDEKVTEKVEELVTEHSKVIETEKETGSTTIILEEDVIQTTQKTLTEVATMSPVSKVTDSLHLTSVDTKIPSSTSTNDTSLKDSVPSNSEDKFDLGEKETHTQETEKPARPSTKPIDVYTSSPEEHVTEREEIKKVSPDLITTETPVTTTIKSEEGTKKHSSEDIYHDKQAVTLIFTETVTEDDNKYSEQVSEDITTSSQAIAQHTTTSKPEYSDSIPDLVELEEHTHKIVDESTTSRSSSEEKSPVQSTKETFDEIVTPLSHSADEADTTQKTLDKVEPLPSFEKENGYDITTDKILDKDKSTQLPGTYDETKYPESLDKTSSESVPSLHPSIEENISYTEIVDKILSDITTTPQSIDQNEINQADIIDKNVKDISTTQHSTSEKDIGPSEATDEDLEESLTTSYPTAEDGTRYFESANKTSEETFTDQPPNSQGEIIHADITDKTVDQIVTTNRIEEEFVPDVTTENNLEGVKTTGLAASVQKTSELETTVKNIQEIATTFTPSVDEESKYTETSNEILEESRSTLTPSSEEETSHAENTDKSFELSTMTSRFDEETSNKITTSKILEEMRTTPTYSSKDESSYSLTTEKSLDVSSTSQSSGYEGQTSNAEEANNILKESTTPYPSFEEKTDRILVTDNILKEPSITISPILVDDTSISESTDKVVDYSVTTPHSTFEVIISHDTTIENISEEVITTLQPTTVKTPIILDEIATSAQFSIEETSHAQVTEKTAEETATTPRISPEIEKTKEGSQKTEPEPEIITEKISEVQIEHAVNIPTENETPVKESTQTSLASLTPVRIDEASTDIIDNLSTSYSPQESDIKYTTVAQEIDITTKTSTQPTEDKTHTVPEDKPYEPTNEILTPVEEILSLNTKATTVRAEEYITTQNPDVADKQKPKDKPIQSAQSTKSPEAAKPSEIQPTDEVPSPEEESHFPPSETSGYGGETDYGDEDQAFGPGTCRYGGKVYVSAQQIPRDDPCDFCFCFRSDIICLQQSCPPPIHGCHEEPIQGFCCPRYECPVSMATTLNVTTTTTTTTTTLPPHFPTHSYKGAAQRRGCQIKGHTYKVGEVVRASSGPCLHCTCGGDGQMKCDPKACTPEPMLRQMIAAAVSAKRRR